MLDEYWRLAQFAAFPKSTIVWANQEDKQFRDLTGFANILPIYWVRLDGKGWYEKRAILSESFTGRY